MKKFPEGAGGGGGIRTHEPRKELAVFKTAAIDRSATPPSMQRKPRSRRGFEPVPFLALTGPLRY